MEDLLGNIIIEFLGRKILLPFFRLTGGGIRWALHFGKVGYQEILNKSYNGRLGFFFWLSATLFIVFFAIL
jgi:hypothetical protein